MKYIVLCTIGVALLTGCGGAGGSANAVNFTASPIRAFSDGAGVGSLNYIANGQQGKGYIITPELATVLAEIENTGEITDINTDGIRIVGTGPNTVIRQGAVTSDGFLINATLVSTTENDVVASLLEEPNSGISILITEGPAATNMPSLGLATYTGTMGLAERANPSSAELGTFSAQVNFGSSNPTVLFNGSTASYSATGLATISNGRFSSSTMTLGTPSGNISGSLRGDFHDSGAADMAGVIFSNNNSGTYTGGFVGSK